MLAKHKKICASQSFGISIWVFFHLYVFIFQPDIWTICKKYISPLLSDCKPAAVVALIFSIKTYLFFPRGSVNIHCGVSHTDGSFCQRMSQCGIPNSRRSQESRRDSLDLSSSSSVHSRNVYAKIITHCNLDQRPQLPLFVLEIHIREV